MRLDRRPQPFIERVRGEPSSSTTHRRRGSTSSACRARFRPSPRPAPAPRPSLAAGACWQVSRKAARRFSGSRTRSHLLTAMTRARPSSAIKSAIWRSCFSKGCSASRSSTTISAKRIALSASPTDSSSARPSTRILRRSPAVSNRSKERPFHARCEAMASRVMPASGPVIMRSSPSSALMRVDLPTFGRPTIAIRKGCGAPRPVPRPPPPRAGPLPAHLLDRLGEVAGAEIVLGRDRDRLAEAERIGLVDRRLGRAPFALVDGKNDGLARDSRTARRRSRPPPPRPPAHR